MTVPIIVMMIVGLILIIISFFITENFTNKEDNYNLDLMAIDENYEFSERELRIIKRKIEDVIANHAKDILYETNDSLASMANEKTLALGDYAVAVCEEIEKNHKEVMFLYSMLDDKQKEIMTTVKMVDETNRQMKDTLSKLKNPITVTAPSDNKVVAEEKIVEEKKTSAIDQLSALAKRKKEAADIVNKPIEQETESQISAPLQQPTEGITEIEKRSTSKKHISHTEAISDRQLVEPEDEIVNEDVHEESDQRNADFDKKFEDEFKENENSNDIILAMHRNGASILEIAKELGLGVGEVKLVIDLYQGE